MEKDKKQARYPPSVVNKCSCCRKQMTAKEAKRHKCL